MCSGLCLFHISAAVAVFVSVSAAAAAAVGAIATAIAASAVSAGIAAFGTAAAGFLAIGSLCFFQAPAFKNCLAGEADLTVFDTGDHHGQFIAKAHDIFHTVDAFAVQLGNVDHTVNARQDLDKGAEISSSDDLAGIDVAEDRGLDEAEDMVTGSIGIGCVGGRDVNQTGFFDVDLCIGVLLELADVLAAGADDGADLIDRDLDGGDARDMRLQVRITATLKSISPR